MPPSKFTDSNHIRFIQALIDSGSTHEQIYAQFKEAHPQMIWTKISFLHKLKQSVKAGDLKNPWSHNDRIKRLGSNALGKGAISGEGSVKDASLQSSRIKDEKEFEQWVYERLDPEKWQVIDIQTGYYEGQQKHKVFSGEYDKDGKALFKNETKIIPMYTFKAKVKLREHLFDVKRFFEALGDELAQIIDKSKKPSRKKEPKRDLLLIPFITDHHIGNVVQDDDYRILYDSKKAEAYYDEIIDQMLDRIRADRMEEIWLPTGNDLIHSDNGSMQTTKGTQLFGENYERAVMIAELMIIRNVEKLKSLGAKKIKLIMVRGNHDWNTTFHLGRSFVQAFKNDPLVEVVTSRRHRIYQQFYQVGIGFSHGHYEDVKQLDRLFSREEPRLWAECKTKAFLIGDKHHWRKNKDLIKVEDEIRQMGLDVIRGSTVCLPDQWHENRGYLEQQSRSQYLVYSREHHLDNSFVPFNIGEF